MWAFSSISDAQPPRLHQIGGVVLELCIVGCRQVNKTMKPTIRGEHPQSATLFALAMCEVVSRHLASGPTTHTIA